MANTETKLRRAKAFNEEALDMMIEHRVQADKVRDSLFQAYELLAAVVKDVDRIGLSGLRSNEDAKAFLKSKNYI